MKPFYRCAAALFLRRRFQYFSSFFSSGTGFRGRRRTRCCPISGDASSSLVAEGGCGAFGGAVAAEAAAAACANACKFRAWLTSAAAAAAVSSSSCGEGVRCSVATWSTADGSAGSSVSICFMIDKQFKSFWDNFTFHLIIQFCAFGSSFVFLEGQVCGKLFAAHFNT